MEKKIISKYPGKCWVCGKQIDIGVPIIYNGRARHEDCVPPPPPPKPKYYIYSPPGEGILVVKMDGGKLRPASPRPRYIGKTDDGMRVFCLGGGISGAPIICTLILDNPPENYYSAPKYAPAESKAGIERDKLEALAAQELNNLKPSSTPKSIDDLTPIN